LVSNGFWHIVSIVKEQDLPVMQKGYEQLNEYLNGLLDCQQLITDFHTRAQGAAKSMRGGRIRGESRKLAQVKFAMKRTRKAKKQDQTRLHDLARGVLAALRRLEVWRSSAKFGVAVSGGADSVALLLLFLELELKNDARTDAPIEIAVVHFNHQLRGKAADADERFVQKLAEAHGLAFYLGSADVAAAAKRTKRNVEDTGRRERYAFFSRLVEERRVDHVATAHTMDDQAETVLAHILRGTGLAGLGGIHAVSGAVLRPLLSTRRGELRKYLKSRKQRWREDATNLDTTKTRARIRKTLIPLLERKFQSEVIAHLAELAERAREDELFLTDAALSELSAGLKSARCELRMGVRELAQTAAPALRGRMVRKIVKELQSRDGELGAGHVASVLELARSGENGKLLRLPGGVEVRREKDALVFRATDNSRGEPEMAIEYEREVTLSAGGETVGIPSLRCAFRFRTIDWLRERSETSNTLAVLDCSQLRAPLVLRNWRPGDRLQPAGRNGVYKLKRLLNKKGISRWERNGWPVLTSDGVIAWARGFPVAAEFAANEKTRSGLVIDEEPL
jgi:tRNA(Ile)-lysidine synthase